MPEDTYEVGYGCNQKMKQQWRESQREREERKNIPNWSRDCPVATLHVYGFIKSSATAERTREAGDRDAWPTSLGPISRDAAGRVHVRSLPGRVGCLEPSKDVKKKKQANKRKMPIRKPANAASGVYTRIERTRTMARSSFAY